MENDNKGLNPYENSSSEENLNSSKEAFSENKEKKIMISFNSKTIVFILSLVAIVTMIISYMFGRIYNSTKGTVITCYVFSWIAGLSLIGALVFYCINLRKTRKIECSPEAIVLLIAILSMLI